MLLLHDDALEMYKDILSIFISIYLISRAEYEKQYIRNKELDDEIEMYREILQREYESLKK